MFYAVGFLAAVVVSVFATRFANQVLAKRVRDDGQQAQFIGEQNQPPFRYF